MSTVREKLAGRTACNYETLPTGDKLDLEVLEVPRTCQKCNQEMVWDTTAGTWGGDWVHVAATECKSYYPHLQCRYCGNTEPGTVNHRQHAWHDATECDRCGGKDGYAIGD